MARIPCQQVMTLEFLSITLQNFLWSLYVSQRDTRLTESIGLQRHGVDAPCLFLFIHTLIIG